MKSTMFQRLKNFSWTSIRSDLSDALSLVSLSVQKQSGVDKQIVTVLCAVSEDFRRTLQVVPRSTFAQEINVSLKQSFSWRSVETLRLTINTRVQLQDDQSSEIFSTQLQDTGSSEVELHQNKQFSKLPDNVCTVVHTKKELIESVFPDTLYNYLGNRCLCNHVT
ncbi:ATP-dependent DNA helicase [Trichonephila clavipes]|nr:ATP-dependent DNA helicase [Trichonephila clavipes]